MGGGRCMARPVPPTPRVVSLVEPSVRSGVRRHRTQGQARLQSQPDSMSTCSSLVPPRSTQSAPQPTSSVVCLLTEERGAPPLLHLALGHSTSLGQARHRGFMRVPSQRARLKMAITEDSGALPQPSETRGRDCGNQPPVGKGSWGGQLLRRGLGGPPARGGAQLRPQS